MSHSNWVHLEDCTIIAATESALLIDYEGDEIWLPRSHVSEGDKYEKGDTDLTISVTDWIARQKGLADD